MNNSLKKRRIDAASKIIHASPQDIYNAYLNKEAVAAWRPPQGMHCKIYEFNPHEGGTFRMAFQYATAHHEVKGKTSAHEDIFKGKFSELIPCKKIVELIEFDTDDPAFFGEMKITTTLAPVNNGTEVSISCENVPGGIKPEDHHKGITSTLNNLAAFTEKQHA
jgi:uncharacterized protein YndB with AHSA1/START domain